MTNYNAPTFVKGGTCWIGVGTNSPETYITDGTVFVTNILRYLDACDTCQTLLCRDSSHMDVCGVDKERPVGQNLVSAADGTCFFKHTKASNGSCPWPRSRVRISATHACRGVILNKFTRPSSQDTRYPTSEKRE